jgi:hypothetical protein
MNHMRLSSNAVLSYLLLYDFSRQVHQFQSCLHAISAISKVVTSFLVSGDNQSLNLLNVLFISLTQILSLL